MKHKIPLKVIAEDYRQIAQHEELLAMEQRRNTPINPAKFNTSWLPQILEVNR